LLVTEEEIIQSMHLITEHLRCIVEPSGAVAASPALHRQIEGDDLRIGIILSGGNLDPDTVPAPHDQRSKADYPKPQEED
jgi:threo-3-hydroxy-L-aspartate ammonia-lyase